MNGQQRNIKIGKLKIHPIERIGDNSEDRVEDAKHSGKVILPHSVFSRIHRIDQPLMIFKLINEEMKSHAFCGVFSFDGEEQKVSAPLWIIKQLQTNSGEMVSIEFVTAKIEKGSFSKFEPLTKAFLEINDPKAVLEHCLTTYVCISREDVISIRYNKKIYELRVCETLPSETIIINECDLTVDFQEMKQQKEEEIKLPEECDLDEIQAKLSEVKKFEAFTGAGQSTGGKKVWGLQNEAKESPKNGNNNKIPLKRGIPDYDYKLGTLFFKRHKNDLNPKEKPMTETNQQKQESKVKTLIGPVKPQVMQSVSAAQTAVNRPVTRSQTQALRSGTNTSRNETKSSKNVTNTSKNDPKRKLNVTSDEKKQKNSKKKKDQ